MDEMSRNTVKVLLEKNEKLLGSISTADEEKMDEALRTKVKKAMRIGLVVRYALRLEEKAEGELLDALRKIMGEADG